MPPSRSEQRCHDPPYLADWYQMSPSLLPTSRKGVLVLESRVLVDFLQYLVYGNATQLFIWDKSNALFKVTERVQDVAVEGLSALSTRRCGCRLNCQRRNPCSSDDFYRSIVNRFLVIGTLLRRLETFALGQRTQ